MLREYLGHAFSLDSKVWRTLRLLLFPGHLTAEYLAGQRVRQIRPLRLYLWTSVLLIAAAETFSLQLGLRLLDNNGIHLFELDISRVESEAGPTLSPMELVLTYIDTPELRRFKALPKADKEKLVRERRRRYAQYFLLLLVPVFAVGLKVCYRDRKRPYAEHLVFCLHSQSFLMLMVLLESKLPEAASPAISLWVFGYFAMALKRVYGGTWLATLARGVGALALDVFGFLILGTILVYLLLAA